MTFRNVLPSSADAELSPAQKAAREWLIEQATKHNVPDPDARPSKSGDTWRLMSRGHAIGRLKVEQVNELREDLVEKLCEQVSVVQADVGRALDGPWQEISRTLHAGRDRVDFIVNACTRALVFFEMGASKQKPNLYKIAKDADEEVRVAGSQELSKLEAKKPPKDETDDQRKQREAKIATLRTASGFKFSGAVLSMLTQRAQSSFIKWSKSRRDERFPHARRGQPIPLRAADGWWLTRAKGSFILEFKIGEGKTCRWQAKVHPGGGNAIAACRELTDQKATKRDAKLFWNSDRKRWVVSMAVGRKRRPPPSGADEPLTMVVRIGMRSLLSAWFSDGGVSEIVNGVRTGTTLVGILERKQELLGRKKSKQRGLSEMTYGPSAVRKRKRRKLGVLGRRERAFVDSECKKVAAFVANLAEQRGATRVIVQVPSKPFSEEDEKHMDRFIVAALRRFPLGELSSRIVWALDKRGLPSEVADLGYDACTCPACGHVDAHNHDPKTQLFSCTKEGCSLDEPLNSDFVAAINAMRRCGISTEELERVLARAKMMVREIRRKRVA